MSADTSATTDVTAMVRDELTRRTRDHTDGLDAVCAYALEPTGKLLRPVLLVESALAVGGSADAVLPAAVGTECGHVASLIHDDIVDDDQLRRGRSSVPYRYDIATALLAGDLLFFRMLETILECRHKDIPDSRVVDAAAVLANASAALCHGEYRELELVGSGFVGVDEYLAVVRAKTAVAFRAACEVGGILAGGTPAEIETLAGYGENLGIAFQIRDDLLPYISDEAPMGKAVGSDIGNQRLTLPVILAYEATAAPGWARLDRALSGELPTEVAYADTRTLLAETGAIGRAHDMAHEFAHRAGEHARQLPATDSRARLLSYAELTITRRS